MAESNHVICSFNEKKLTVTHITYDDDRYGTDWFTTYSFDEANTKKLMDILDITEYTTEAASAKIPAWSELRSFFKDNDIHYGWYTYEDYPGGYHAEGEE